MYSSCESFRALSHVLLPTCSYPRALASTTPPPSPPSPINSTCPKTKENVKPAVYTCSGQQTMALLYCTLYVYLLYTCRITCDLLYRGIFINLFYFM